MMSSNLNNYARAQGFKKKNSNTNLDLTGKLNDKLGDLKQKLQKEKQMMRKTGKRFREESTMISQDASVSTNYPPKTQQIGSETKHDISVGGDEPVKQIISLKDISLTDHTTKDDGLKSSRLFEKQMKQQKKRSKEVHDFLMNLGLADFAEPLIQSGFDEIQMLSHLKTQDLNAVMMRAHQQILLLNSIQSLKRGDDQINTKQDINEHINSKSTLWRAKTEPMQNGAKTQRINSSQILARMKAPQRGQAQQESCLKPGSFLYTVGSRNWSVQDQVRRACSVCYRVQQQMERKGDCYYCAKCYAFVSEDLLDISIGKSMNREYKKFQHL